MRVKELSRVGFMLSQASISEGEFLLFKNYIAENSGIVISPEKSYLIETRLSKYMADAGVNSFGEFYDYIVSNSDPSMPQKIINAITINETQWFRNEAPWKVLEERLLPGLVAELASGKKTRVRIWCAAVSTGQEIYSTAMCVDNYLSENRVKGINLSNFDFFASDISSHVLDIEKKGRYDKISMMRGLSDRYKTGYFTENGSAWDIDPKIRDAVRFERFNLQNSCLKFGLFDVIFCRYVLIYFSDALKREIITKMYGSLLNGGVLFTGNYAIYGLFEDNFDANHYGNLTYYSKKEGLK
jgi:chemotaxis protein methyltransferase CheR